MSTTISGKVSPWHLCIVITQAKTSGNCVPEAWNEVLPFTGNIACVLNIDTALLLKCLYRLLDFASYPTSALSNSTKIASILFAISSVITYFTVPTAPLVNPSLRSMFVVSTTLAPTFTCNTFLRFPVFWGL